MASAFFAAANVTLPPAIRHTRTHSLDLLFIATGQSLSLLSPLAGCWPRMARRVGGFGGECVVLVLPSLACTLPCSIEPMLSAEGAKKDAAAAWKLGQFAIPAVASYHFVFISPMKGRPSPRAGVRAPFWSSSFYGETHNRWREPP